eukprot:14198418-Alexandrium_andersonii.AAC.1
MASVWTGGEVNDDGSEQSRPELTLWLKLVRVPTPNWTRLWSEPSSRAELSSLRPGIQQKLETS